MDAGLFSAEPEQDSSNKNPPWFDGLVDTEDCRTAVVGLPAVHERFKVTELKDVLRIMQEKVTRSETYFGIPTMKSPTDAWVYQEIITELKPDVIVEIGNFRGGSTLMLAHWLDQLNKGIVVAVDLNHASIDQKAWNHPRIRWVTGHADDVFPGVKDRCRNAETVLVIEDSSHEYDDTLKILRKYSELVTKNSYLIVEDTICWHGLDVGPNPGPYEATQDFLKENKQFEVDKAREGFLITWNPDGYLKKL